jgi:hypothetical protein
MANKKILWGMLITALTFGLVLVGCPTEGDDGGNSGNENTLPAANGTNALSGKVYVDYSTKIEFSSTAEGAANGTYKKLTVKYNDDDHEAVLVNGKYTYAEVEAGYYSWNETAKTITISPEKIALREQGGYGSLKTKTEYRAAEQTMLNEVKAEMGETLFNEQLASMGFSSVSAYLDSAVAEAFKNVTNNYAFSSDGKALFLDVALPANKGTNELAGQTYYGTTWNEADEEVKNTNEKYVFTATDCTYTYTYGGGGSSSNTYIYAYDGVDKKVYLKTPTTDRDTRYGQLAGTTTSGNFSSVDENKAAQVNGQYYRLEEYKYYVTDKTLRYN